MQPNDNHIRQQLFDFDEVPATDAFHMQQSWQQLEAQLHSQKRRSKVVPIAAAAGVLLLLSTAWLLQNKDTSEVTVAKPVVQPSSVSNSNSNLTVNVATSRQHTLVSVAPSMPVKTPQLSTNNIQVSTGNAGIHLPQGMPQDTTTNTVDATTIATLQAPIDTPVIVANNTANQMPKAKLKVVHMNELFPAQTGTLEQATAQAQRLSEAAAIEAVPAPKSKQLLPFFYTSAKNN